ncbi:hypothetical protein ACFPTO_23480 [Paraburkholderia denitrificans]|uniref:Uncharacterized protein n=1 Tax=Paraburkholderia denitrificans TaxID=694025 RepID=A0ABW0JFG5_9BURK
MRSVQDLDGLMSKIAHASDAQKNDIEQIHRAVGEMDKATQQNAAPV